MLTKNLIAAFLLFVTCNVCYCQTDQLSTLPLSSTLKQNIDGLGPFKLGKTTIKFLDTLSKNINKKIILVNDFSKAFSIKGKFIVKLQADSNTESLPFGSYSPRTSVYLLTNYKLLNKYENESTYLSFYDDTLSSIEILNADAQLPIIDLKTKYGEPELKDVSEDCTCYISNEKFNFSNRIYLYIWKGNDNDIVATIGEKRKRDGCERGSVCNLTVSNTNLDKKFKEENESHIKEYKSINQQKKVNELKDL